MNRQIKIIAQASGKATTTTVSNVNPAATGADMLSFAKQLNALTNNTYGESNLVETTNLDTETVPTRGQE